MGPAGGMMGRMTQHSAPSYKDAVEARKEQIGGHLESHGHSKAAWIGVGVVVLGALVASIATVAAVVPVVVAGLAVMALGGPLGWFLSRKGLGAKGMQGGDGEKKVVS